MKTLCKILHSVWYKVGLFILLLILWRNAVFYIYDHLPKSEDSKHFTITLTCLVVLTLTVILTRVLLPALDKKEPKKEC